MTAYFDKKHDQGKQRWDLINFSIIKVIVTVLTYGAKKYSANSWQTVPDGVERYKAAFLRHWEAHWAKDYIDVESNLPHLWLCFCNLYFLIWFDFKRQYRQSPRNIRK
jgi:hypothetical protein